MNIIKGKSCLIEADSRAVGRAKYVSEDEAMDYVTRYAVTNDVFELGILGLG